jgi:hypothetical protein
MSRLLLLCCLPGCVLVVDGDGDPVTEVIEVGPFSAVRNEVFVDVTVREGPPGEVTFYCDERLIERLIVEVEGDTLVVGKERGWLLGVGGACTLEAPTDTLTAAAVSGSGRVEVEGAWTGFTEADVSGAGGLWLEDVAGEAIDLRLSGAGGLEVGALTAGSVRVDVSGAGSARAAGVAESLTVDVSGAGAANLAELVVVDADVRVSGSGSARVNASGAVTGSLSGAGDVVVSGGADVDVEVSGAGRVIEE